MTEPLIAARRPHRSTHHGMALEDPYHWLKDPAYPKVNDADILTYLKAENDYFASQMDTHQPLIDTLYQELVDRQQLDDASVPYKMKNYLYQWRFRDDAQYRVWSRAPVDDPEAMQVILDEPALAAEHDYFRLGGFAVSPDGQYLAWSSDTNGSERFTIQIKNLVTGEILDDVIEQSLGSPVWCRDNATFFYLIVNDNWRSFQVRAHRLGEPPDHDRIVYEEADESFFVGLGETQSERYIIINTGDHVTNEQRLVPADEPEAEPRVISPRRTGHEYDIDHRGDRFYIRTNDTHKNFRLVIAPVDHPEPDNWAPMIDGSEAHYLRGLMCLRDWVILEERLNGLDQIRVIADDGQEHFVQFPESAYHATLGVNAEFDMQVIRLSYESMVTPRTVYDYDLVTRQLTTRKVQQIPSGYDASQYTTERLVATARDGAQVPVSVVYKTDFKKTGQGPLYLYAYGAYGHAMPPSFSTPDCRCWSAATPLPLPTSVVAMIWAITGMKTASSHSGPIRLTILWTWPGTWSSSNSPAPAASPSPVAARAANSWARWSIKPPSCGARWWRMCRLSMCSIPCWMPTCPSPPLNGRSGAIRSKTRPRLNGFGRTHRTTNSRRGITRRSW